MPSNKLTFENRHGDKIVARLDLPANCEPVAYALFAHCFTCSKDLKAAHNISHALTREGIAVLRFDFTGLGESDGDFADTNFSSNVADLVDAAAYLEETHGAPQILVGHSLGGAAVLMAAHSLPSVKAVATIGAPAEPEHVVKLLESSRAEIEAEGEADVTLGGRTFKVKKQFLDDLDETHLREVIRTLRRPLLIFHSPVDNVVGVDNARKIFSAARHPKSYVSLDSADHLLTKEADSRYVGQVVSAWAQKYLETKAEPSWYDDVRDNRVAVRTETGLRTEMLANGFSLVADEPLKVGGTNTGPTPYDYLASALGACTAMTLRMYADRKGWPLQAVTVKVRHQKVHAEDSQADTGAGKPQKLDRFERVIAVEGDLDEKQQARLLEIANRCPVHRTLEADVHIESRLEPPT